MNAVKAKKKKQDYNTEAHTAVKKLTMETMVTAHFYVEDRNDDVRGGDCTLERIQDFH